MDVIHVPMKPLPVTASLTVEGDQVTFFHPTEGLFNGTLSPDGESIAWDGDGPSVEAADTLFDFFFGGD